MDLADHVGRIQRLLDGERALKETLRDKEASIRGLGLKVHELDLQLEEEKQFSKVLEASHSQELKQIHQLEGQVDELESENNIAELKARRLSAKITSMSGSGGSPRSKKNVIVNKVVQTDITADFFV